MWHVTDETKEEKRNSGNGKRRKNEQVSIGDDDREKGKKLYGPRSRGEHSFLWRPLRLAVVLTCGCG